MIGLVLCGGKSTRMGADKGLLETEGASWAQSAAEKILSVGLPVFFSINAEQFESYSLSFPPAKLIRDRGEISVHGPLSGVLSAHLQMPDEDFLVLACDMPLMENSIIQKLKSTEERNPDHEAYVFTNIGEPEPLCGIYKGKALARIVSLYHSNELKKHSMKFMLDHLSVYVIQLGDEEKKYFRNFNSHAELNGL